MKDKPELLDQDVPPAAAGKNWGFTESGFAAMRTVVPFMDNLPHSEWEPSSNTARVVGVPIHFSYETIAGFVHALSYLAIPLFLASVTGLVKKRGE